MVDQVMPATRQKFGQHFLTDERAIAEIVQLISTQPGEHILEIGPGRGALTRHLLQRIGDGTLELVEIDGELTEYLRASLGEHANLRIHHADAIRFDPGKLLNTGRKLRVVGNLPYNVGSPLLLRMLTKWETRTIADFHVMLQSEVVKRLTASPGESDYSGLSVLVGCFAKCSELMAVDADAFDPPPQVRSAFARMIPHPPLVNKAQWPHLKALVAAAFSQRRKKVRHALGKHFSAAQLEACGIDPERRPQTLGAGSFARLAAAYEKTL